MWNQSHLGLKILYCIISSATGETKLKKTDTKLYVLVTPLSTQDNEKLLEQLKSSFKRAINRNKCQTKITSEAENQYLDFLTDPSFQGVNRLFVFSFEGDRKVHIGHYLPEVEIKDYNVMINGKTVFDQQVKNDIKTYDNIRKISTGQVDDYTTGCLLDYNYLKEHYKTMAIGLSTQQGTWLWSKDNTTK